MEKLVNGWTADTKNNTRRDWRWVKLANDQVDWPTGQVTEDTDSFDILSTLESGFRETKENIDEYVEAVRQSTSYQPKVT